VRTAIGRAGLIPSRVRAAEPCKWALEVESWRFVLADIIRLVLSRPRRGDVVIDAPTAAVTDAYEAVELVAWRTMACKLRELGVHVRRYKDAMEGLPVGAARNSAVDRLTMALANIDLQFEACASRARRLQHRIRSAGDRPS
jgi:hypothetical protein